MMASSRAGIDSTTSTIRMMAISTQPRKYPAITPSAVPSTNDTQTEVKATSSETRDPWMMRLRMSRPSSSVPSR